jgi:hypothetical protein
MTKLLHPFELKNRINCLRRFAESYGQQLREGLDQLADPSPGVVADPRRAWAPFKEVCDGVTMVPSTNVFICSFTRINES